MRPNYKLKRSVQALDKANQLKKETWEQAQADCI